MAGKRAHHGPEKLRRGVNEYFKINMEDLDNITPAGLLLHLGISRERWSVYEDKPQLSGICNNAKLRIEHLATKRMYEKGRVADIFMLKNMGWQDKQEVESKTTLIDNKLTDGQAQSIIERFAQRKGIEEKARGTASEAYPRGVKPHLQTGKK